VLSGLFPSRSATYQAAYDAYLATVPDGNPKTLGLAVGAEVAAGILALRAADGRSVALAPYVPGTAPGQFRGINPVGRPNPFIKPFVLTSNAQFRAPGPPALTSATYAADVNETKALGSAASTTRTAEQTETARFHTEPPPNFWPRNMRTFAMTGRSLAEQARLMAMVWVAQADGRTPASNRSTSISPGVPPAPSRSTATATPRPSSMRPGPRSCPRPTIRNTRRRTAASPPRWRKCCAATTDTANVTFDMTSMVTGSTHHFTTTAGLVDEVQMARIAGGMHFRSATVDGAALGKSVGAWVAANAFKRR
jgi:hypothetical protein